MNPILYEATETEFKSNGIGRLSECTHCLVTEGRNGVYECEFQYPITGKRYADIQKGRIISVTHDDKKDRQPFIIYRQSAPINGIVTFNAHHISYGLSDIVTRPFTASSASVALNGLKSYAMNTNPFTFWTDNTAAGAFKLNVPTSVRNALGGVRGSVLDVYGGEYEFDKWQVKLHSRRGRANGVTIRYGKNLTDITYESDILGLYDAIVPYWTNGTTLIYGIVNIGTSGWSNHKAVAMDFSADFDDVPTVAQLNTRAATYLSNNKPWIPKTNITVDFVALWQTEEYKNIAPLERVRLCDTVKVIYTELGVEATAKVIKTVWNPLLDRYDSLELGEAKTSFADIIAKEATDSATAEVPTTSMMQKAIDHATDLITGGLGGNIVIQYDGNGKPTEILAMDTDDVSTAVHVLRINVNGIGFSSSGIEGPYTSAWTLDGKFVADFITAGHMRFNILQGGELTLGGVDNGNGVLIVLDASGNEVGRFDNLGLSAIGDLIIKQSGKTARFMSVPYRYRQGTIETTGTSTGFQIDYQDGDTVTTSKQFIPINSGFFVENAMSTSVGCFSGYLCYEDETKSSGYEYQWAYYENGEITLYSVPISGETEGILYLGGNFIRFGGEDRNIRIYDNIFAISLPNINRFIYADQDGGGRLSVNSKWVEFTSSSSIRYKHNVKLIEDDELDPHRLLRLPVKQFEWNDDHPLQYPDMANKTIPGFIAEDVAEIYPSAVIHDVEGNIESWDERRVIPGMLKLIQEQHEKIESLMYRITKLESIVASL